MEPAFTATGCTAAPAEGAPPADPPPLVRPPRRPVTKPFCAGHGHIQHPVGAAAQTHSKRVRPGFHRVVCNLRREPPVVFQPLHQACAHGLGRHRCLPRGFELDRNPFFQGADDGRDLPAMPPAIILQQPFATVAVLDKDCLRFFRSVLSASREALRLPFATPLCCPSMETCSAHLAIGRAEVDFGAWGQLDRLPGLDLPPCAIPETACQAELDKLVSPSTDGSLGLRVTSATAPPGDWAIRPGTWCSSRRSPGTMTRNFAPTRKRFPLLPAGAADGGVARGSGRRIRGQPNPGAVAGATRRRRVGHRWSVNRRGRSQPPRGTYLAAGGGCTEDHARLQNAGDWVRSREP